MIGASGFDMDNEAAPARGAAMAIEDVRLLLVRPADLVVVALRFVGFEVGAGALTSSSGAAKIEVTLPPQSTGEAAWVAGTLSVARVGGPSRLTFQVAGGVVVPLTADGVLAALAAATVEHGDAPVGAEPLSVELPWHIRFAPRPVANGDALLSDVPDSAHAGVGGATGLWHLRLEAASGLALVPIGMDADVEVVPALDQGRRASLTDQATPPAAPPTTPCMDLSALGGTMSAKGSWPDFSWEQHIVLGRDMSMRTESRGLLYPFGHRAVLVKTSNRQLLPPGTGSADAGLLEESWLIITDPVRGRSSDEALARVLPFDEVEILERVVPLGPPEQPDQVSLPRVPKRLDALRQEKADLETEQQTVNDSIPGLVDQMRQAIRDNGELDKQDPASQLSPISTQISEQEARQTASNEWDSSNPDHQETGQRIVTDPVSGEQTIEEFSELVPGDPNPDPWGQRDQNFLEGLRSQAQPLIDAINAIEEGIVNRIAALVDEDSFLAAGGDLGVAVARLRELRAIVPTRSAQIDAIVAEAARPHPVAVWPQSPGGGRLNLPIRCDGVRLSMPVLFLYDEDLPDTEDWPAFAPLSDPIVQRDIANVWNAEEGRHVPVAGIPLNLVRASNLAPNDVLRVQRLSFGASPEAGGGFRAVLQQAQVVLAAAQALVPGVKEAVDVVYSEAYRLRGEAEHAALDLVKPLGVDFSKAADQAGGLIAPNFAAEVLGRFDGPISKEALVGLITQKPDLSTVFGATKLLGIPLGSLLAPLTEAIPKPLKIVPEPGGGARMSWTDLTLRDHGPLRVTSGKTKLELTVVRSPTTTTTTCSLDSFALVLPPGPIELVRLEFDSLKFTQEQGRPPDLDVKGLKVKIGGDLGLLEALQDAVKLDDVAPRVHTSSTGMSVDYTLAVPEVTAGMFLLQNIAVRAAVDVPFDGRPIVTTLAFASRDKPFHLGVSVFGGGGYLLFEIDDGGIRTLEASLDFGAAVAINVGIAKAEVHALGGVRFNLEGDLVRVSGFLRIGGSVDILGLVSVTVELRVELTYEAPRLTGRATAVIEIDVTFWSGSIELDSGDYTFVGGSTPEAIPPSSSISVPPPTLPDWQKYRNAFEPA